MQKELRVFVDHKKDGFVVRRGFTGSEGHIEISRLRKTNVSVFVEITKTLAKQLGAVFSLKCSENAKRLGFVEG